MPCNHHHHRESKNLGIVFCLNFGFAILEFIGGFLTQSVALMADAVHDMGDAIAIALAWIFAKIGQKKRSPKFSYGYKRFSLLSALIASIILIIGALFMFFMAVKRLQNPIEVKSDLMILFAIFGVLVNGLAVWKIKSGKTMNEKVISIHLLEDLLGWGTVLLGAVVIYFTDWYIIDPIMAIIISLWIFIQGVKNGVQTTQLFLQAIPENVDISALTQNIKNLKNIKNFHDLHIWSLDGEKNVASCHIVVTENIFKNISKTESLKKEVREIFSHAEISHVTLEIETSKSHCGLENC